MDKKIINKAKTKKKVPIFQLPTKDNKSIKSKKKKHLFSRKTKKKLIKKKNKYPCLPPIAREMSSSQES